jgi:hypothetical protein
MSENYRILHGGGKNSVEAGAQLSEHVNRAIAEGWKAVGGVTAVPDVAGQGQNYVEFAQAMAK